jgi:hypothetical protein
VSYDLFFRSRNKEARFSREDFVRHFTDRPHYQVKDDQAWYGNQDSGVYFTFDYNDRTEAQEEDDETDASLLPVAFNLNYFRPHPFALEAEPEVAAFVRAFDLTVSDPQMSGMGDDGEYSREGFLSGWNHGNAFGYQAIGGQDPTLKFSTMPAARIEAAWRWNFNREARQAATGEGAFVPLMFFLDVNGEIQTGVAWGDGIPILLPAVDLVLVARQRLAPKGWFRSKQDIVVFSWKEIEPIAQRFRKAEGALECFELFYQDTPADIDQVIREKQPPKALPTAVTFDKVLDRELVEQAAQ